MPKTRKTVYRILLLGETGCGKSTFINYMANYFLGGKLTAKHNYKKMKIVIPNKVFPKVTDKIGDHSEANVKDQTQSQTTKTTVLPFKDENGNTIELIDTPGFADTRKNQDDANINNILKKASTVDFLTAIVLIINGSHARKTTTLKYVLNKLEGNIPDALLDNLIVVFTNCDETTRNFDTNLLKELSPKRHFHMQNNAFSNCEQKKNEKQWQRLESEWDASIDTLKEFMETIYGLNEVSANAFKEMFIYKQALQAASSEIIVKQKNLLQAIDILEEKQELLKNENDRVEKNKDFKKMEKIEVFELQEKDYFSTVCQTHYKERICHERCGLAKQETTHTTHFLSCTAHNRGTGSCSVCECSMTIHFHAFSIPVKTMKEEETIIMEMQARYLDATNKMKECKNDIDIQTTLKGNLNKEVANLKKSLLQTCRDLKSLCKNFNFHEELETIVETLRKEASISHNFRNRKEFTETADAIEQLLSSDEFKIEKRFEINDVTSSETSSTEDSDGNNSEDENRSQKHQANGLSKVNNDSSESDDDSNNYKEKNDSDNVNSSLKSNKNSKKQHFDFSRLYNQLVKRHQETD